MRLVPFYYINSVHLSSFLISVFDNIVATIARSKRKIGSVQTWLNTVTCNFVREKKRFLPVWSNDVVGWWRLPFTGFTRAGGSRTRQDELIFASTDECHRLHLGWWTILGCFLKQNKFESNNYIFATKFLPSGSCMACLQDTLNINHNTPQV